jgi:hypothetical protein
MRGVPRSYIGACGCAAYAVNLLGPRLPSQLRYWRSTFTFVQLRFNFLSERLSDSVPAYAGKGGGGGAYATHGFAGLTPLALHKTKISFFDLDSVQSTYKHPRLTACTLLPIACLHAVALFSLMAPSCACAKRPRLTACTLLPHRMPACRGPLL